jgi:Alpha-1,3-glucanase catalytic domain D2/Alpha-1,3-glucanase catalytic domain D1/NedA-like, galactose-binding domain/CARDB
MRRISRAATSKRPVRLAAASLALTLIAALTWAATANAAGGPNLSLGKTATASSTNGPYVTGNLNDGNQASYWESTNNAFPQWAQIDLGSDQSIDQVVLRLPTGWGARTQTLTLQGSSNGSGFATIVSSATYTFNPSSANTVTINFTAFTTRYVRVNITANTGWSAAQLSELEIYGTATSGSGNLAAGRPTAESGHADVYQSGNVVDGNQGTYWESVNNAFPQWVQVDLGSSVSVNRVVLKIPAGWGARSQTLSIQGSTNGSTFTNIVGSAAYGFDPGGGNSVTINFTATTTRYVRANITANTGWPAGQISELEVYGPGGGGGDTTPPTVPGTLSLSQNGTTITLNWGASTDTGGSGLAGYDIYRNGSLATGVGAGTTTFSETQPTNVTVSYFVRARDGAGNQSGNSNTVTRNGTGGPGTNVALNKPVTATGSTFTFVPANATDGNVTTYWEGSASYPQDLTVALGANHAINSLVVKLNPDPAWGTRTQTFQVLGRDQGSSTYTNLVSSAAYTFAQGTNVVTIPVSATTADVRLRFTANTGAPSGQVAELEVFGTPSPNPDLVVSNVSWSPASPLENQAVTLSATVTNSGDAASGAATVGFYLGTTLRGTATVAGLAVNASATVNVNAGTVTAGTYQVTAKVDESNSVIERNDANNSATAASSLVVSQISSADLVPVVSWSPNNPSAGATVTFSVAIRNDGNVATSNTSHGITLTLLNESGATVITRTGSVSGAIAAGTTSGAANLGTWTAANGRYTVRVVLAGDSAEDASKTANNTSNTPFFVGRGANMPYDMYEAEDGSIGGGAQLLSPNRVIGDLAGEASGRRAVTLPSTGSYVQWTTRGSTNTLVVRASTPDSAGGGGQTSTLSIYVNGTFHKKITFNSKFSWVYGDEANPSNSPGSGPRHIYDEANVMLNSTVAAGSVIKLQRDSGDGQTTVDFANTELVSPIANPNPALYVTPAGFTQQDVQNALDTVRQDTTGKLGVYLPAGTYTTNFKFNVYGKAVQVIGAGPWYTRFQTPQDQSNTEAGFDVQSSASGSTFKNFSFFGNFTSRSGGGKVWGDLQNADNLTIDNTWVEHMLCAYWGVGTDGLTFTNNRIRNTWADGINMTGDSHNVRVANVDARTNGDDAFALFSATDCGGSVGNHDNVFENLTATLTWRAAGVAVYGGYNNVFRNIYVADQLTYPGVTISSIDFDIPMVGFGTQPTTFENITIDRAGGHFWGNQVFPALWVMSGDKIFRGIRVNNVDINAPTYGGIMFQTKYEGGSPDFPVTDTIFTNINISNVTQSADQFNAKSGWGIWANELPEPGQGPAVGSATFNNLTFTNVFQNIRNTTSTFTITVNP